MRLGLRHFGAFAALVLAGCGDSSGDTGGGTEDTTATSTMTATTMMTAATATTAMTATTDSTTATTASTGMTATTMGSSTTEGTTTSDTMVDGSGTSDFMCDFQSQTDFCAECQHENCCDLLTLCASVPDCLCVAECSGVTGVPGIDQCLTDCGLQERPMFFPELAECMTTTCPDSDECFP